MKRAMLASAFLFVFIFASFSQGSKPEKNVENITGFAIDIDKIAFTVLNSGYTNKSSFELEIAKKDNYYEIKLIRIKEDEGKMMPEPIQVTYTKEELKGKIDLRYVVHLLNPFSIYNF